MNVYVEEAGVKCGLMAPVRHLKNVLRSAVLLGLTAALSVSALSQEREVKGTLTFVAGPTVYASIGGNQGILDSCRAMIRSGSDTVAVLHFLATSSRSSSWTVVRTARALVAGDTLVAFLPAETKPPSVASKDTVRSSLEVPRDFVSRVNRRYAENEALALHGRLSFQYYGVQFENQTSSMAQPALAFSLDGTLRDVPLRFNIYGVHRQQVRGSLSPLDKLSQPQTRFYRASLEYDDGSTMMQAGRIYPMSSLPMSAVDGFSAGRHIGNFIAGFAGGAEPSLTIRLRQKHLWKGMAFVGYQTSTPFYLGTGLMYTRSYIQRALVRETISLSFSSLVPSGISLSGFSDIDLRRPLAQATSSDPSITSVMLLGSVQVVPQLSLLAGIDGARPVPSATDYGIIPDTLFNRTLRSGLTTGATLSIQSWLWTVNFSPRMGEEASLGKEYSAATSLGTYNLLASGVEVRSNVNVNSNVFTQYSSYGIQARKTFLDIDWRVRFQYYTTTIRQMKSKLAGTQSGFDIVAMFSRSLSLMATVDLWRGASRMNVLFLEVSWRF